MDFTHLEDLKEHQSWTEDREHHERLLQWYLHVRFDRFRTPGPMVHVEDFIDSVRSSSALAKAIGVDSLAKCSIEPLSTTVLSMNFFDRLEKHGIVNGKTQSITRCMDIDLDDKIVNDLLGDVLLNPDSENNTIFTSAEKTEFMYDLLKTFVRGGELCQPSDFVSDYLNVVKSLYKTCLTAYLKQDEIHISSKVFKVNATTYLILDTHKRETTVLTIQPKDGL